MTMRRVRGMKRLFRFPWRTSAQIRDEVDAELEFHLAKRAEDLERVGLSPEEARREAAADFGDLEAARRALTAYGESSERQTRLRAVFEDFWRDWKYAWRSLRRSPGFTAVAIAVLALGIGVNSAAFNLVDLLLVRPVLIEEPERVVGIYGQHVERPDRWSSFSYPEYRDIRDLNRTFTDVAAFTVSILGVGERDGTRRVMAGVVSANYFAAFGVPVALGREFVASEESAGGAAAVAVVSHDFWERNGRDPAILGSTLFVNGELVEVIGVAAEGFTGSTALFSPELWLPLGMLERTSSVAMNGRPRSLEDPRNGAFMLFGRMRDSVSAADVESDLRALTARLAPQYPSPDGQVHRYVRAPLPRVSIGSAPETDSFLLVGALLLTAMSGVVLLIACLNLANMFLARSRTRRTEMAIRQSLGGGRWRLVRQLLTEGLLLALAGGAAGLVLAYWGTRWLLSSLSGYVPIGITLLLDVRVNLWVLGATVAVAILATMLFGLGPALKATDHNLSASLKEHPAERRRPGLRFGFALPPRGFLLVAQLALTLMLLTAGGLFARGAFATAEIDPGFSLDGGIVVDLDAGLLGYDEPRVRGIYTQVLDRLRSMSEIEYAALASNVPFGDATYDVVVQTVGASADDFAQGHDLAVGDGYFDALSLPLLRGRGFTVAEAASAGGTQVAVIDEPLAQRLFGEIDVVGRQVQIPNPDPSTAPDVLEIVGVARGVRQSVTDEDPVPHIYRPFGQRFQSNMHVHVRIAESVADPALLLATIRDELRAINPALPVMSLETLLAHRDRGVLVRVIRAGGAVFSTLGVLALLLAVVGVYGVKAFIMAQRTREIGVRMALGATGGAVVRQMLRESLALTAAGLAIGLLLSFGLARLLRNLLFDVGAADPAVFLGATAVLAGAATLAAYLPARRASRIEPTAALRHD
jgi:predicted permease